MLRAQFRGIDAKITAGTMDAGLPLLVVCDICLLYTSDAADERSSVDLGGRRILKKKKIAHKNTNTQHSKQT